MQGIAYISEKQKHTQRYRAIHTQEHLVFFVGMCGGEEYRAAKREAIRVYLNQVVKGLGCKYRSVFCLVWFYPIIMG